MKRYLERNWNFENEFKRNNCTWHFIVKIRWILEEDKKNTISVESLFSKIALQRIIKN